MWLDRVVLPPEPFALRRARRLSPARHWGSGRDRHGPLTLADRGHVGKNGGGSKVDALTSDTAAQSPVALPRLLRRPVKGGRRQVFRGYHWAYLSLGLILLAVIVAAGIIGVLVFELSPTEVVAVGGFTKTLPGWLLIPLTWIALVTFQIVKRRVDNPTKTIFRLIRFKSDWFLRGLFILVWFPFIGKAFGIIKSSIPAINPFYADAILADLDVWILGDDAWKISHYLTPEWSVLVMDRIYILWFTYVILVTGIFSFTRNTRLQIRGALTFQLSWILLGIVLAIAISSVGPVFYDRVYGGDRYTDLIFTLSNVHERHGLFATQALNFLISNAGKPTLGAGISAMPSMHVAMAFFGFLVAMSFEGKVWLKAFTAAFTAATLFGSVHLGWHYLTDGLVGIVLVYLIWIAVGRFVDAVYRAQDIAC